MGRRGIYMLALAVLIAGGMAPLRAHPNHSTVAYAFQEPLNKLVCTNYALDALMVRLGGLSYIDVLDPCGHLTNRTVTLCHTRRTTVGEIAAEALELHDLKYVSFEHPLGSALAILVVSNIRTEVCFPDGTEGFTMLLPLVWSNEFVSALGTNVTFESARSANVFTL